MGNKLSNVERTPKRIEPYSSFRKPPEPKDSNLSQYSAPQITDLSSISFDQQVVYYEEDYCGYDSGSARVSDAKAFYQNLNKRLDSISAPTDNFRGYRRGDKRSTLCSRCKTLILQDNITLIQGEEEMNPLLIFLKKLMAEIRVNEEYELKQSFVDNCAYTCGARPSPDLISWIQSGEYEPTPMVRFLKALIEEFRSNEEQKKLLALQSKCFPSKKEDNPGLSGCGQVESASKKLRNKSRMASKLPQSLQEVYEEESMHVPSGNIPKKLKNRRSIPPIVLPSTKEESVYRPISNKLKNKTKPSSNMLPSTLKEESVYVNVEAAPEKLKSNTRTSRSHKEESVYVKVEDAPKTLRGRTRLSLNLPQSHQEEDSVNGPRKLRSRTRPSSKFLSSTQKEVSAYANLDATKKSRRRTRLSLKPLPSIKEEELDYVNMEGGSKKLKGRTNTLLKLLPSTEKDESEYVPMKRITKKLTEDTKAEEKQKVPYQPHCNVRRKWSYYQSIREEEMKSKTHALVDYEVSRKMQGSVDDNSKLAFNAVQGRIIPCEKCHAKNRCPREENWKETETKNPIHLPKEEVEHIVGKKDSVDHSDQQERQNGKSLYLVKVDVHYPVNAENEKGGIKSSGDSKNNDAKSDENDIVLSECSKDDDDIEVISLNDSLEARAFQVELNSNLSLPTATEEEESKTGQRKRTWPNEKQKNRLSGYKKKIRLPTKWFRSVEKFQKMKEEKKAKESKKK